MEDLEHAAGELFGLAVAQRLPISESFSSDVLLFVADDGKRYVVKRPYARNKADREIAAYRALHGHPHVPELLDISHHDDATHLLIEGLDGTTWDNVDAATPGLLRHLGRAMHGINSVPALDFHGHQTWHALLAANADNYLQAIGEDDRDLAIEGRRLLSRRMADIPDASDAVLVHFDLRPGNILVNEGSFVGIIDFEGCRGGHPSMDFFKLWEQVASVLPGGLDEIVEGFSEAGPAPAWAEPQQLSELMAIYAAYHGLAGLAWCYTRNKFDGDFPTVNRARIADALET